MLSNNTDNASSRFTQDIDPKFIRTMKDDLTNPIDTSPGNISPTSENPFIKENLPIDHNMSQDLEIQKLAGNAGIGSNQNTANSYLQKDFENSTSEGIDQVPIFHDFSSTLPKNETGIQNVPVNKPTNAIENPTPTTGISENLLPFQKEKTLPDDQIKSMPSSPLVNRPEIGATQQAKIQTPAENKGEKIIVAVILLLIIISLTGGGYYFWATKRDASEQTIEVSITEDATTKVTQQQPQTENPVIIDPISEKYSLEKPNLLTINTNTVTPLEIKSLFIKIGEEVKKINPPKPLEFILVDENNNPIAFSRFITLAKIELPKTLVSNFDETFSLFYYFDNSFVKTGLQIDSKSKVATTSEMKNAEKNIIQALDILYLENKFAPQNPAFNNGTYKSFQIRYFNIDQATQASFDYTVTENYLIIGTSKDTLRSIVENKQL